MAKDGTYRLSQGLEVAHRTIWRLVLGPEVAGFGLLILTPIIDWQHISVGVAEDSLITLALFVASRTLGFLPSILAVAVLFDTYRQTRPEPRAPPDWAQGSGGLDQTPA